MAVVAFPAGAAQAAASVSGGGSTFAAPEIQQFASDTSGAPYNLQVNYAATGSGAGRENYAQGTYQYGTSDIVFTPNDGPLAAGAATQHPYRYVTVTAGGLGFMYNIVVGGQRWTGLNLTRQNVCQIFTGAITMWNDPRLVSTPGDAILASVDKRIQPVVRSDQAGESYVLSQYCLAVDRADWLTFVNYVLGNSEQRDPGGLERRPGSGPRRQPQPGRAHRVLAPSAGRRGQCHHPERRLQSGAIRRRPEHRFEFHHLRGGRLRQGCRLSHGLGPKPGRRFCAAQRQQRAAGTVVRQSQRAGTFNLDFTGPNPGAYFPSTYSYILAPVSTNAPASAGGDQSMAEFLCYAVGQGQNDAARLLYAPLSREVTAISVQAIEAIPGAPPASQCGIGGPAPAVTPGQVVGNNGNPGPSAGRRFRRRCGRDRRLEW